MTAVAGHGISIEVPAHWDARLFRRRGGGTTLHVANFALPYADGEFGTRATQSMRPDGLFLALTEYLPDGHLAPGRGLFAGGPPRRLAPSDFNPRALLHLRAGQTGVQRFFSSADRAFCLYTVASELHLAAHADLATALVKTLRVDARRPS